MGFVVLPDVRFLAFFGFLALFGFCFVWFFNDVQLLSFSLETNGTWLLWFCPLFGFLAQETQETEQFKKTEQC
jgi:hypothetical protein